MNQDTVDKIKLKMEEIANGMGLTLVSVKFISQGENGPTLEVLIDKDYSIDMETIEKFTDIASPALDEIPEIGEEAYLLDISSGGSERIIPFADVPKLVGRYLDIKLKKSGETITPKVEEADGTVIRGFYFIKGRKKKVELREEDVECIHMGYKA